MLEFKIAVKALHVQGCGVGVFQRCEVCAALGGLAVGSLVCLLFSPYAIVKLERTYLTLVTIYCASDSSYESDARAAAYA